MTEYVYGRGAWPEHLILDAIDLWVREHGSPPTGLAWRYAGYGHPSVVTVRERFGSMAAAIREAGYDATTRRGGYRPYWTRRRIADAIVEWRIVHGRWPTARDWWRPHRGPRTGGAERPSTGTVRRVFGSWGEALRYAGRTGSLRINREVDFDRPPSEEELRDEASRHRATTAKQLWRAQTAIAGRPSSSRPRPRADYLRDWRREREREIQDLDEETLLALLEQEEA